MEYIIYLYKYFLSRFVDHGDFGHFLEISTGKNRFSPQREHLSIFKKRKKRGGDESKDFSLRG